MRTSDRALSQVEDNSPELESVNHIFLLIFINFTNEKGKARSDPRSTGTTNANPAIITRLCLAFRAKQGAFLAFVVSDLGLKPLYFLIDEHMTA